MNTTIKDLQLAISADAWADWSKQYQTETDRGLAITAAAILDYLLEKMIEGFILDDSKATKRVLGDPFSPLGSFSARITAAFSLGLISKDEMDDLDCIRDIRNDFAHQTTSPSFSDQPISQKVSTLKMPKLIPAEIVDKSTITPRKLFIDGASMLSTFIHIRT